MSLVTLWLFFSQSLSTPTVDTSPGWNWSHSSIFRFHFSQLLWKNYFPQCLYQSTLALDHWVAQHYCQHTPVPINTFFYFIIPCDSVVILCFQRSCILSNVCFSWCWGVEGMSFYGRVFASMCIALGLTSSSANQKSWFHCASVSAQFCDDHQMSILCRKVEQDWFQVHSWAIQRKNR